MRRPRGRRGQELPPVGWIEVEGSLARQPEFELEIPVPPEIKLRPVLKPVPASDTVPRMASSETVRVRARREQRRVAEQERTRVRARRASVMVATGAACLALVAGLVVAFSGSSTPEVTTGPAPAKRLLPAGPPEPAVLAMQDELRLTLPIHESQVTAIGYHGAGGEALPLDPVGTQGNAGFIDRVSDKLFGEGESATGLEYYLLGGEGEPTSGLDVGGPVEADVYAPVDGTIIAISDTTVNGERFGAEIDIQPSGNPSFVVTVSRLDMDESLTVGSTVSAARSKIGRVVDMTSVETAALADYTQDSGQHITITVRPAASLTAP